MTKTYVHRYVSQQGFGPYIVGITSTKLLEVIKFHRFKTEDQAKHFAGTYRAHGRRAKYMGYIGT